MATRKNTTKVERAKERVDEMATKIAKECLLIDTLETRNSDRLDFHDVAAWTVREALQRAFMEGMKLGMSQGTFWYDEYREATK